jgi:hypothetical protein
VATIFTLSLAALAAFGGVVLMALPVLLYGQSALRSELAILVVLGGGALLFAIIEVVLGMGIARRSRLATLAAMVLASISLLGNFVTTFTSGDVGGALFGMLVMAAYLYILVRAYQAISQAISARR